MNLAENRRGVINGTIFVSLSLFSAKEDRVQVLPVPQIMVRLSAHPLIRDRSSPAKS